jgi:hypothetical protein
MERRGQLTATFVREAGKPDRVYVVRPDGTEVSWSFPTYGDALPHDLVHLVVESAAGLRDGFWGRVARGIDPARVNQMADGAAGKLADKYQGFGEDLGELLHAEALAAYPWLVDDADLRDGLLAAWKDGTGAAFPAPDAARIADVRAALAPLTARWRALLPKGSHAVDFDPARPHLALG